MNKTGINWCDLTWNPVTGCTKIMQGCKNCYAEGIAKRFWGDRKFSDIEFHENRLQAKELKSKRGKVIFVNSMSDLFHETLQPEQVQKVLDVIKDHPQHTFLVLTKRIKNISYFQLKDTPNLWLGYSASTQKDLDARVDYLLSSDAKTKWLSLEPLIEPIIIHQTRIDWVVVGCESGYNRRLCNNEWINDIAWECKATNTPVWIKQIDIIDRITDDIGEFPKHLQIREKP